MTNILTFNKLTEHGTIQRMKIDLESNKDARKLLSEFVVLGFNHPLIISPETVEYKLSKFLVTLGFLKKYTIFALFLL